MAHLLSLNEWGKYLEPIKVPIPSSALRVAVFGSFYRGIAVTKAVLNLQNSNPTLVQMVGLATDAITDPRSKISAQKRIWQFVNHANREAMEKAVTSTAIDYGIPVYSGKIKTDFFRHEILSKWDPEVILMCTFGQLIDSSIFEYPKYGMYNLHPSHLAEGKYPGPNPFIDMLNSAENTTRMTLHEVDENFDTGRVVGYSPPISINLSPEMN